MKKLTLLAASAFLCLSTAANATIIYSNSGLSGAFETENFDTNAGNQTAAASQFTGITFRAGNVVSNDYNGSYPNMTNSVIANFSRYTAQDPTSFIFDADLSDLAFAFVSNLQSTTFSAFLNSSLVESMTFNTDLSGQYVNVSGMTFDEIRITSTGSNDAYILDDMQFRTAQVPEPAILALLGLGVAGIGFSRRKVKV